MHDPKFEKEVQRRMHDLEFVPSESVWAGIQKGMVPRDRRRAVAIFWWLFPGVLLLAGGIAMYRHSASTSVVAKAAPVVKPRAVPAGNGVGESEKTGGGSATLDGKGVVEVEEGAARNGTRGMGVRRGEDERGGNGTVADGGGRKLETDGMQENGALAEGLVEQATGGVGKRASGSRFHPGLAGYMYSRARVEAPRLFMQPVNTAVSGLTRSRHSWSAGFAGGVGGSWIYSSSGNALIAASASSGRYSYANSSSTAQSLSYQAANNGGSKRSMNVVQVGYSYWAGVYGEKQVSKRWSVDIGLNLHYYSVRFQTKSQVNLFVPTSASLLVPSPLTYGLNASNTNLTDNFRTYVNNYYFVEVPASVSWRLNHSHSMPLFLRGGAVVSYLMSSNGLYYDKGSAAYKSDNSVIRRMQAGVNSGLMVGLPVKGVQIQAGPEVQYALTNMLTTGSGSGHILYGGMRVALMR